MVFELVVYQELMFEVVRGLDVELLIVSKKVGEFYICYDIGYFINIFQVFFVDFCCVIMIIVLLNLGDGFCLIGIIILRNLDFSCLVLFFCDFIKLYEMYQFKLIELFVRENMVEFVVGNQLMFFVLGRIRNFIGNFIVLIFLDMWFKCIVCNME